MSKITIELELGARPSEREIEVVNILVTNKIPKRQVVFLRPNRTKGAKTPDITIDGLPWEITKYRKAWQIYSRSCRTSWVETG